MGPNMNNRTITNKTLRILCMLTVLFSMASLSVARAQQLIPRPAPELTHQSAEE